MAKEKIGKVLIVEDTDSLRITLKVRLENAGLEVVSAIDGQEAIQLLEKVIPDLILADIVMPKVNGVEFLHYVKSQKKYKDIPVIMLTAKGEKKDVMLAKQAGADDYIIKPFDGTKLIDKVLLFIQSKKHKKNIESVQREVDQQAERRKKEKKDLL